MHNRKKPAIFEAFRMKRSGGIWSKRRSQLLKMRGTLKFTDPNWEEDGPEGVSHETFFFFGLKNTHHGIEVWIVVTI